MEQLIDPLDRLFAGLRLSPTRYRGKDAALFFDLVGALIEPDFVVVDYGAGRGRQADNFPQARLRGRVTRVIGVDVDDAVRTNPYLDEAHVSAPGERLPLDDASIDLLFAYAVLEHIADPASVAAEIQRVLKPGGWFCAWTPYKWGYVGLGVQAIPNALHARLLRVIAPDSSGAARREEDVFPTLYRMNTLAAIGRLFPGFHNASFTGNGEPSYHFGLGIMKAVWSAVMALGFHKTLFVFVQKPQ